MEVEEMVEVEVSVDKISKIKELFKIQSPSSEEKDIRNYIISEICSIKNISFSTDKIGNLLITKGSVNKGEYFPCYISHMDTVHRRADNTKVYIVDTKDGTKMFAKSGNHNQGINGDDRCGIWIGLQLLNRLPNIKVLFTVEEEIGGFGASEVDLKFFDNVGYLIEGDRRGNSDLITNIWDDMCSKEFLDKLVEPCIRYGYKEARGMFTDIDEILNRGVEVCALNLSVGYYEPHTNSEYVILEDMYSACDFVEEMITVLGCNIYEFKREIYKSSYKQYDGDYYDDYDYGNWNWKSDNNSKTVNKCHCIPELTNMECDACNPVFEQHSGIMCRCGEELEERYYSFNCPYCNAIYLHNA